MQSRFECEEDKEAKYHPCKRSKSTQRARVEVWMKRLEEAGRERCFLDDLGKRCRSARRVLGLPWPAAGSRERRKVGDASA